MTNNDILRRIRYIFDYSDAKMMALFGLADLKVHREELIAWLTKEDEEGYRECVDSVLATFLNGLIIEKRGKRDGPQPKPEVRLTNNLIFMKLKIALNLKSGEVIDILKEAGFTLREPELTSFFRKPDHKNYRPCMDQVLRNFLKGLQIKLRPTPPPPS